jgi:hypothetical protein
MKFRTAASTLERPIEFDKHGLKSLARILGLVQHLDMGSTYGKQEMNQVGFCFGLHRKMGGLESRTAFYVDLASAKALMATIEHEL